MRGPRTKLVGLAAAAAAVVLSGCSTFTDNDVVASVDGTDIEQSQYEPLAQEYFERGDFFGTTAPEGGQADGDAARGLLGAMIRQTVLLNLLDEHGVNGAEQRQAFVDTFPENDLSPDLLDLLADNNADFQGQLLSTIPSQDEDALRSMYLDQPASTGAVCLRQILVSTEAEADQVLDDLASGADFAELAESASIDPAAAGTGGAVSTADSDCISVQAVQSNAPAFAAAIIDGQVGVPTVPLESSNGWFIFVHRPWDEIADSVVALHAGGSSGGLLFAGAQATADVAVDPRFGTWDPATGVVAAIS